MEIIQNCRVEKNISSVGKARAARFPYFYHRVIFLIFENFLWKRHLLINSGTTVTLVSPQTSFWPQRIPPTMLLRDDVACATCFHVGPTEDVLMRWLLQSSFHYKFQDFSWTKNMMSPVWWCAGRILYLPTYQCIQWESQLPINSR